MATTEVSATISRAAAEFWCAGCGDLISIAVLGEQPSTAKELSGAPVRLWSGHCPACGSGVKVIAGSRVSRVVFEVPA